MEVLEFILIVILISLSGVMAPGPLFATAVSEGRYNKFSGLLISTGHAIVEVPIIIALFFFGALFTGEFLKSVVGIIGGAFLIYMAFMEINSKKREFNGKRTSIRAIITGSAMSLANPYFLIWWMSVGFSLALRAISFGLVGLIIFIIVHELCDFGWLGFVSYTSSKTVEIWEKSQNILSMVSAGIFLIFGIYFLYSGLTSILAG